MYDQEWRNSSINWILLSPRLLIQNHSKLSITEKRKNKAKYLTRNSTTLKLVKANMPNTVKSLGYIKCYSSSSPRPVKSHSTTIRYNCQKIYSWSRRPKTTLEIRNQKATFLLDINNSIIYKFFKEFSNHRKKTNRVVNKTPSDAYWRVQLVCKKVQAHSSLEPLLECIQNQTPLINQGSSWPFNHLGSYRNIMQFQISIRRENRLRDTWDIKIRVLRKVFSKQFCFITCRRQYLWAVELRRYSRFTFVDNTIGNLPKVLRAKFLGCDWLFCFISICKLGRFKNSFATITSQWKL